MLTLLVLSGWLLTAVFAALILVPWITNRRHLVSVWTFFLLGSINFISMGMVQNARGIQRGEFDREIPIFLAATVLFYGIVAAIYLMPMKKPAPAAWPKWPQDTNANLVKVALGFAIGGILAGFAPYVPGAQILYILNGPMCIAGFGVALALLWRNPLNPFFWIVAFVCFCAGLFNVFTFGTGRREVLALFMMLPIVGYWMYFRLAPKGRTVIGIGVLGMVAVLVVTAYATFRHSRETDSGTATRALQRIQMLPGAIAERAQNITLFGEIGSVIEGQNAIYVALQAQWMIDRGLLETDPLATLKFIVVNPVPRAIWPDKPIGLGKILPLAVGNPRITWGPSVIGHCFYDGGWPVVVLYAGLLGFTIRYLDLRMLQDPANPWQVAIIGCVNGHMIGFARGDCGTFGVNILGPLVILSLILHASRVLMGAREQMYPQIAPA